MAEIPIHAMKAVAERLDALRRTFILGIKLTVDEAVLAGRKAAAKVET